jgi:hypothetical protein
VGRYVGLGAVSLLALTAVYLRGLRRGQQATASPHD